MRLQHSNKKGLAKAVGSLQALPLLLLLPAFLLFSQGLLERVSAGNELRARAEWSDLVCWQQFPVS